MKGQHDRGAFDALNFRRCDRGFILTSDNRDNGYGYPARIFAFDRVEDLAAWLVEQYENPPEPESKQGTFDA